MSSQPSWGISPPRWELPPDTHVGSVHLVVTDLNQSLAYYEHILGLRLHDRGSNTVVLGTPDVPLVSLRTEPGLTPARKGAFGLYHFAMLLPSRTALGRFASHLSRAGVHVGMADHLVSEALYLTDPDGLGIEVYADRPAQEWQQRDHELAMTVDPLDIADLIAAGGEQSWDGVPPGTSIGHVHLHVGSLAEAEAFYHVGVGFRKTVWTYSGALFLAADGYHHHLGTNTWAPGPAARNTEARLLEWDLVVPNTHAISEITTSPRRGGYTVEEGETELTTTDPWNTRLRVVVRRPYAGGMTSGA